MMSIAITITDPSSLTYREANILADYLYAAAQPATDGDCAGANDQAKRPIIVNTSFTWADAVAVRQGDVPDIADSLSPPMITEDTQQNDRDPNTLDMLDVTPPQPATAIATDFSAICATAPVPPVPAASTLHSAVPLDTAGLPWDSRIHARSRAVIADGTWRKKKQLDPALITQVEAELRQTMGAPAAPAPVPVPFLSAADALQAQVAVMTAPAPVPDALVIPVAPAPVPDAPVIPVAPAPIPQPVVAAPEVPGIPAPLATDAPGFFREIGKHVARRDILTTDLMAYARELELADLTGLQLRPDLIPAMREKVRAHLAAKGVTL